MSKEQEEAKDLNKKIRKSLWDEALAPLKAACAAFVSALSDIFVFVWFLICFAVGIGVISAGVYAAYQGWISTHTLGHVALMVAGASAIVLGFGQLWKTVFRVIKRKG